jgi:prefoldin subunit 4
MRIGEVFIDVDNDEAESAVKAKHKSVKQQLTELVKERDTIVAEMTKLKAVLYAKFGKSINLEVNEKAA